MEGHDSPAPVWRGDWALRLGAMSKPESRWQTLSERPDAIAWLIAGFTVLRLVLAATLPLLPEEAYYWSWSRHLDWSYFDHPPLASYRHCAERVVFGQTVFGIELRGGALVARLEPAVGAVTSSMYGDRRLAFWSIAAPQSDCAVPDLRRRADARRAVDLRLDRRRMVGVAREPVGRCSLVVRGGRLRRSVLAGQVFGRAAAADGVFQLADQRHWLPKPRPWLAALLALAIFAPVLYWNARHDWVSLAFQSSRRVGAMHGFAPRYFLLLVASQFALLTP